MPLDHPAAKGASVAKLRKLNDEAAAYIAAKGWAAFERQYFDPLAWEEAEEARRRALQAAREAKRDRQRRAAALKGRVSRERQVAKLPARQRRKRGAAVAVLLERLAGGEPVRASAVKAAAAAAGVSERTLKTAKRELGVETERRGWGPGSHIVWSLPKRGRSRRP